MRLKSTRIFYLPPRLDDGEGFQIGKTGPSIRNKKNISRTLESSEMRTALSSVGAWKHSFFLGCTNKP